VTSVSNVGHVNSLNANFGERRNPDVGCIRARRKLGGAWERRPAKEFTFSLLPFSDKPELLQHAQVVVALPLLDYLAILDAVYGDAF
jgi:hypothetical protein